MKKFLLAAAMILAFSGIAEARGCRLFGGRLFGGGRSCGGTTYYSQSSYCQPQVIQGGAGRTIYMPSPNDTPAEVTQPPKEPKKVPLPMPGAND